MLPLVATTLVVCAPGFPGSTAEAQPAMDALAQAIASSAHLPEGSMAAVYDETAEGCLRRLPPKDVAVLLASLPFYLEHEQDLRLAPRLMVVPQDGKPLQKWMLVTGRDRPASLAGYTVHASVTSRRFVHAVAPSLPSDVNIVASTTLLSSLRRAANGEKLAVLLNDAQFAAVGKLPLAASLAAVESSPPLPFAVIAIVDERIDERRWKTLGAALTAMSGEPSAREVLEGVRTSGFVPLDSKAMAEARAAWRRAK